MSAVIGFTLTDAPVKRSVLDDMDGISLIELSDCKIANNYTKTWMEKPEGIMIHILNLKSYIYQGKHLRLPACYVRKKDKHSNITIDCKEYNEAIILSLPEIFEYSMAEEIPISEGIEYCIIHELGHAFVHTWNHGSSDSIHRKRRTKRRLEIVEN